MVHAVQVEIMHLGKSYTFEVGQGENILDVAIAGGKTMQLALSVISCAPLSSVMYRNHHVLGPSCTQYCPMLVHAC